MNQTAGVFASLRHAAAPPMAYEKELLDHLVGAGEQRRRHRDPERFGGLEFTMKSNLVGCSTGKSAGLAPLRILSTKVADRRK